MTAPRVADDNASAAAPTIEVVVTDLSRVSVEQSAGTVANSLGRSSSFEWRDSEVGSEVSLEFRVLGPLEVLDAGRRLEPGRARQRNLLTAFLVHAGDVVSTNRMTCIR